LRKELLVNLRSWRVLAYSLFLAAVIILGAYVPRDSFPYELSLSQGPLLMILVLGCAFIFAVDAVSREHEKGTAPLLFVTPASRGTMLAAKALVPVAAWAATFAALSVSYMSQGLGTQFAILWLVSLLCATLLFLAALGLLLLISAAVKGRGAPFAGVVAVLFMFFSSGYFPVDMAAAVRWLSPAYHEYLLFDDLLDGALGSPLPLALLVLEIVAFFGLALWAFRRSEVSR
jgi:ABC-type transport system involved in multi-copper enzyme maturation permease subunit